MTDITYAIAIEGSRLRGPGQRRAFVTLLVLSAFSVGCIITTVLICLIPTTPWYAVVLIPVVLAGTLSIIAAIAAQRNVRTRFAIRTLETARRTPEVWKFVCLPMNVSSLNSVSKLQAIPDRHLTVVSRTYFVIEETGLTVWVERDRSFLFVAAIQRNDISNFQVVRSQSPAAVFSISVGDQAIGKLAIMPTRGTLISQGRVTDEALSALERWVARRT